MPADELADLDVRVNGGPIPPAARTDIRSVTIDDAVDTLSMFAIELYNWDDDGLKVSWSDRSLFAVGNAVEISLGYVGALTEMMSAEVTSLEATFGSGSPPTLTVRGYDYRHRLARGRKTRTFSKMKDSAIVAQVAREAGLRAEATDTKSVLPYVVQSNQTDLEFLQHRARLIGFEAYVRDKVLHFRPPPIARPAAVRLTLADDIVEFTPRLSALRQVDEVTVRGWDVKKKEAFVGKAATGQELSTMGGKSVGSRVARKAFGKAATVTVDQAVPHKAAADQMALGQLNGHALTYVQGEAACHGRTQVRAGMVVDIDGAGTTFSGPYYVTSARHAVTHDGGYETHLTVQRTGA
jgi:phage protein D